MRGFLSLLFCLWISGLQAQEVYLAGNVQGHPAGTMVRVQVYADAFSQRLTTLGSTQTDSKGNFGMHFSITEVQYAFLAVGLRKTEFVLRPGSTYHFTVFPDTANQKGSVFDRQQPLAIDLKADDGRLNQQIGMLNQQVDDFVLNHFRDVYQLHNKNVIETFQKQINSGFPADISDYFKQYARYSLASLFWAGRTESAETIAKMYFIGKKVLYHNVRYCNFFKDFFQAYFESKIKGPFTKIQLAQIVPERNLHVLDSLFSLDPLLKADARVRQLAEMVMMEKYYHDKLFNSGDFDALFQQIVQRSVFVENRKVAGNYLFRLRWMAPGTVAPAFQLPDVMGKEHQLADFQSKFVLLSFFKTDCPLCLRDLDLLEKMQQNLGSNFTHLTVLMGNPDSVWIQKILSGRFTWPFLLLGNQLPLLEKYQVRSFPAYVLLAPGGKVAMAPAPMPAEGAGERISHFISRYVNNHQTGRSP